MALFPDEGLLHCSCNGPLPLGARRIDGIYIETVRARRQAEAGAEGGTGFLRVFLYPINPDLHAGKGAGDR